MTAKGKLTEKQEGFAFAVGYESKSYSQAYRENYKVKPETLDTTIWSKASKIANEYKVSTRIDYWKSKKIEESKRAFSWDLKEAEKELRAIIKKNKNDLLRAEQLGENANPAIINTSISAIKVLNETFDKITKEYNDLQKRREVSDMTREERIILLSEIATKSGKESDMIKAIDTLNKMEGDYTSKVELSGEVKTNPYTDLTTEELRRLANVPEDG
ncbi:MULTISPECIES: hypothetical protein [Lactococcus]|uniref:Terminase n=1 Tax=Lactococcus garvieae TaxID=1363 RepID=A0AAX3NFU0_9LACT|nr:MULTISPECIES: hypothetical protein [Lactococcus]WEA14890.1 hypothetical protein PWF74_05115 [Lactococcus garvieae]